MKKQTLADVNGSSFLGKSFDFKRNAFILYIITDYILLENMILFEMEKHL